MLHLSGEDSPLARMFYVMEFLDGRIFWDPSLPDASGNDERAAIYDAMNATLAALHDVDLEAASPRKEGERPRLSMSTSRWVSLVNGMSAYRASVSKDERRVRCAPEIQLARSCAAPIRGSVP